MMCYLTHYPYFCLFLPSYWEHKLENSVSDPILGSYWLIVSTFLWIKQTIMVDPSVHKQRWETHTRRQSKWLPSQGRSLPVFHTILCLSAVRILLLWMWFSYEKHVKQFIAGWQQLTSWMFLWEFVLSRSQSLRLEVCVQELE